MSRLNYILIYILSIFSMGCLDRESNNMMEVHENSTSNLEYSDNIANNISFWSKICNTLCPCCYGGREEQYDVSYYQKRIVVQNPTSNLRFHLTNEGFEYITDRETDLLVGKYGINKVEPRMSEDFKIVKFFEDSNLNLKPPKILRENSICGYDFRSIFHIVQWPVKLPGYEEYKQDVFVGNSSKRNENKNILSQLFNKLEDPDGNNINIKFNDKHDLQKNYSDIFNISSSKIKHSLLSYQFFCKRKIDDGNNVLIEDDIMLTKLKGDDSDMGYRDEHRNFDKASLLETLLAFRETIRSGNIADLENKYFSVSTKIINNMQNSTESSSIFIFLSKKKGGYEINFVPQPIGDDFCGKNNEAYYFISRSVVDFSKVKRTLDCCCGLWAPKCNINPCWCVYKANYPCGCVICDGATCAVNSRQNCICRVIDDNCGPCGLCLCFTTDTCCCVFGWTPICFGGGLYNNFLTPKECVEECCNCKCYREKNISCC